MSKDEILKSIYKDIDELLKIERSTPHFEISRSVNFKFPMKSKSLYQNLRYDLEQLRLNNEVDIDHVSVVSHRKVFGKIITLIKRGIRKATFWLYNPLFERISKYNALNNKLLDHLCSEIDRIIDNNTEMFNKNVSDILNHVDLELYTQTNKLSKKYFALLSDMQNAINESVEKKCDLLNNKQREVESLFDNRCSELERVLEEFSSSLKKNYDSIISIVNNKYNDFLQNLEDVKIENSNNMQKFLQEMQDLKVQVEKYEMEVTTLTAKLKMLIEKTQLEICEEGVINNDINTIGTEMVYYEFQEVFRGSEKLIAERQQQYIHIVRRAYENCKAPLLDIGSGRGEFLNLCRDAGIEACGVDTNSKMVEHCKGIGLNIIHGEGLSYLSALPDGSLSAVTAFQVIEHLSSKKLLELIQISFDKLKQGGVVVFETINPDCIDAFKNFFVDMTHTRPVYSSVIKFMFELVGFKDIEIILTSPFEDEMKLVGNDRNTEMINSYLFGYRDYAIVGWKR